MRAKEGKATPKNSTTHVVRAGPHRYSSNDTPDPPEHQRAVEPWLSALFQADNLNLLVGSGFTTAIADAACAPQVNMEPVAFQGRLRRFGQARRQG